MGAPTARDWVAQVLQASTQAAGTRRRIVGNRLAQKLIPSDVTAQHSQTLLTVSPTHLIDTICGRFWRQKKLTPGVPVLDAASDRSPLLKRREKPECFAVGYYRFR